MEFNSHKAIYLQIVDYICEKVLIKEWLAGGRILSVRDLGVQLEVNPNTVMRSYEHLETNGVITNKRGVGFFLTEDAIEKTVVLQQQIFITESLPLLFKNMYLLQISFDEMKAQYEAFCKLNYSQQ
jgi:DNA-binding transcriptional regulator YhcF (GntR family)